MRRKRHRDRGVRAMLTDVETIVGLRVLISNSAIQVQRLHDELTVGADHRKQAEITAKACEVAATAIGEAMPALRRLARKPRAT